MAALDPGTTSDERVARARKKAQARYEFRWNLAVYIAVNAMLVVIWYFVTGGFFWPIFPIFGWGLGVVGDYYFAYVQGDKTWVDRETEKILGEQQSKAS